MDRVEADNTGHQHSQRKPTPYVAALLCTLGPVSIYSLTALGQQIGRRASLQLAGATALLGSVAGFVAMGFPNQ